jgi:hypothetical protein
MATSRPPIDPFNELVQGMVAYFEWAFFPNGGVEANANNAGREYNDHFHRPYTMLLMADVKSGRWGMGTTQDSISEALGILSDRSWVSDALNEGWMSIDIYMRLRCWPLRPSDWEPHLDKQLLSAMARSGFIAAAQSYAQFVKTRPTLAPQRMDAMNYELTCEIFARLSTWTPAFVMGDVSAAASIVNDVCNDAKREVCPPWYSKDRQAVVEAEIKRLSGSPSAAFEHLAQLQRDWLDVFAATDFALEQERNRENK